MLLWPQRLHIGVGQFPADLKFYWLHFEVTAENDASITEPLLAIPQHTRVGEPQYIISLFRQFLREQENIHRSMALELILLLILQQISAAASEQPVDSPGMRWPESAANHSHPVPPADFRLNVGERVALQCGLSGARFPWRFPADANRSVAPSAGKGGRKTVNQRFAVANRGGDEMWI